MEDWIYLRVAGNGEVIEYLKLEFVYWLKEVYFNKERRFFKWDSILLKDMKLEKIEEGSGWSHGTYQATTEVKLKKAEKEE